MWGELRMDRIALALLIVVSVAPAKLSPPPSMTPSTVEKVTLELLQVLVQRAVSLELGLLLVEAVHSLQILSPTTAALQVEAAA